MRINTNVAALNTYRQLSMNSTNTSKSIEKLSSGLRINKAGDDAAGLTISEKMRAQIRGLNQASSNAQDGISLIQTAEGALNETHAILQRMRELANQSSNGTVTPEEREAMQDEIAELNEEIDRIGNTTEFNTMKLLNGNMDEGISVAAGVSRGDSVLGKKAADVTGANDLGGQNLSAVVFNDETITIDGHDITIEWGRHLTSEEAGLIQRDSTSGGAGVLSSDERTKVTEAIERAINTAIDEYNESNSSGATVARVDVSDSGTAMAIKSGLEGVESEIAFEGSATSVLTAFFGDITDTSNSGGPADISAEGDNIIDFSSKGATSVLFSINGVDFESGGLTVSATDLSADTVATELETQINASILAYNQNAGKSSGDDGFIEDVEVSVKDGAFEISSPSGSITFTERSGETTLAGLGLDKVQTEDSQQGAISLQIGANRGQIMSFDIKDMRSTALGTDKIDVSTETGASEALDTLDAAIRKVSKQRNALGASQNRLEHSIKNLDASAENLRTAESRIRDVDMAKEMMEFTKNNILSQAAQSMLAQANQQPQGVLQLLR